MLYSDVSEMLGQSSRIKQNYLVNTKDYRLYVHFSKVVSYIQYMWCICSLLCNGMGSCL